MGGLGSGRQWSGYGKSLTDEYRRLDVRRWQREGFLKPGRSFGWQWTCDGETVASINVKAEANHVILGYRHRSNGSDWKQENYSVWLDWTPCHFGGQRAWFLCPASGCGRRVALLYGGAIFACRHCHQLAYASQKEASYDRMARRADKIRVRLGWEEGILNTSGLKPKRMHWKTYWRLVAEYDAYVNASLAGAMLRFGMAL